MHEKWFTSDWHLFHENTIKKFKKADGSPLRDFKGLWEMHETLVENHNSLVKPGDYVYHLGDVTFALHEAFRVLMNRFNGKFRLIVGNHDKLQDHRLTVHFEKIMLWHGFKEHNFTATHMPIMLSQLRDGAFNVHGHTHSNNMEDKHYVNVCVEQTDYKPVHIDELTERIKNG